MPNPPRSRAFMKALEFKILKQREYDGKEIAAFTRPYRLHVRRGGLYHDDTPKQTLMKIAPMTIDYLYDVAGRDALIWVTENKEAFYELCEMITHAIFKLETEGIFVNIDDDDDFEQK